MCLVEERLSSVSCRRDQCLAEGRLSSGWGVGTLCSEERKLHQGMGTLCPAEGTMCSAEARGRAQGGKSMPSREYTLNSEEGDPSPISHRGKAAPTESILCPAKETLCSHGVDTVTWVRQAAFLVVRAPSEGSEPTWALSAWVTSSEYPARLLLVGAIWDIRGWR